MRVGLKVSRSRFYVSELEQVISFVYLHVLICKIKRLVYKISNMFLILISVLIQEECLDSGNVLDSGTGIGPVTSGGTNGRRW